MLGPVPEMHWREAGRPGDKTDSGPLSTAYLAPAKTMPRGRGADPGECPAEERWELEYYFNTHLFGLQFFKHLSVGGYNYLLLPTLPRFTSGNPWNWVAKKITSLFLQTSE